MRLGEEHIGTPLGQRAKIYLNGVEQHHCLEADEEQGFVIRYKTIPSYNTIGRRVSFEIDPAGGTFVTEQVFGKVRIVDPWPDQPTGLTQVSPTAVLSQAGVGQPAPDQIPGA